MPAMLSRISHYRLASLLASSVPRRYRCRRGIIFIASRGVVIIGHQNISCREQSSSRTSPFLAGRFEISTTSYSQAIGLFSRLFRRAKKNLSGRWRRAETARWYALPHRLSMAALSATAKPNYVFMSYQGMPVSRYYRFVGSPARHSQNHYRRWRSSAQSTIRSLIKPKCRAPMPTCNNAHTHLRPPEHRMLELRRSNSICHGQLASCARGAPFQ